MQIYKAYAKDGNLDSPLLTGFGTVEKEYGAEP